jgi:hypothetical protein
LSDTDSRARPLDPAAAAAMHQIAISEESMKLDRVSIGGCKVALRKWHSNCQCLLLTCFLIDLFLVGPAHGGCTDIDFADSHSTICSV